ncbi:ABC-three component system protein [Chondromyces crocatus]|uniref:ABC-three component system protein n=1 Tax=Chondromyces crocatus TaxID=52 RepID=UPI0012E1CBA1|nr:ABC-three component system protein [Chondromyces crocatus]
MFLRKQGTAFQDFFADMMDAVHPSDFERVRPYGNHGDLKCDGYLRSRGLVFQVYAPREMKLPALKRKISVDFNGAKKHWKKEMRGWVLVHNDADGLPAEAVKLLEDLRTQNPDLSIDQWGCEQMQQLALFMPRASLIKHFGRPPTRKDFDVLGFESLAEVLMTIRTAAPTPPDEILPVSPTKLEANALSRTVASYLQLGRERDRLVERYFEKHPNPLFGEEVATAFHSEYLRLRAERRRPDQVFAALQSFAGGSTRGDAEHEAAVLAVLSYLFDRCDIFEPADNKAASS